MICESINQHWVSRIWHQGQWIACLKVVLACTRVRHLPSWHGIAAKRIIHPFGNFVTHGRNIRQAGTQNPLFHPARPDEGLDKLDLCHLAYVERRVESEHATLLDVFLWREEDIGRQGYRQ